MSEDDLLLHLNVILNLIAFYVGVNGQRASSEKASYDPPTKTKQNKKIKQTNKQKTCSVSYHVTLFYNFNLSYNSPYNSPNNSQKSNFPFQTAT